MAVTPSEAGVPATPNSSARPVAWSWLRGRTHRGLSPIFWQEQRHSAAGQGVSYLLHTAHTYRRVLLKIYHLP